ncbi:MAG: peptidylprolyl isomerase [Flavobacteriaceae bacterium]|nr:peptidylprolyl isomerase [Flavobacteriaceae bacterium]
MNFIRTSLALVMALFIMGSSSCQKDKYPELGDGLYAEIVTSKGTMVAKLTPDKTPVTVANFVALAEGTHPMVSDDFKDKPFYNGLIFHRVMNDFMIQGGCPNGNGSGNPGYKFGDEFDDSLKHDKPGILSMANPGPNSNGSQFFITEKPTPWLDNRHSVFGELVLGMEIQDTISNVKVLQGNKPEVDVTIDAINIIRQGFDARKFDAVSVWETELPLLEEKRKKKEEEARLKREEEQRLIKEKSEIAKAEFMKNNASLKGRVENLPIGISMIFTKEGTGKKPTSAQKALIDYAGYFENGELFDTSWSAIAKEHGKYNETRDQQGGYAPFPMIYNETARLVPGFRAAMLNMKVGDKARVFIPSYLGYGPAGWGNGLIPPNTNLIFDLELVGIEGEN